MQTESEGMEYSMQMESKIGVAILLSDKIDFKTRTSKRQRHYTMMKGSIQ